MSRLSIITSILTLSIMSTPARAAADVFDSHVWSHRLIVVFSATADDSRRLRLDQTISAAEAEIAERDLRIIRVSPDAPVTIDNTRVANAAAAEIYRSFDVDPEHFSVILIGKDGGVKMKTDSLPGLSEIFDLIDSMPMRQLEMQQQN